MGNPWTSGGSRLPVPENVEPPFPLAGIVRGGFPQHEVIPVPVTQVIPAFAGGCLFQTEHTEELLRCKLPVAGLSPEDKGAQDYPPSVHDELPGGNLVTPENIAYERMEGEAYPQDELVLVKSYTY